MQLNCHKRSRLSDAVCITTRGVGMDVASFGSARNALTLLCLHCPCGANLPADRHRPGIASRSGYPDGSPLYPRQTSPPAWDGPCEGFPSGRLISGSLVLPFAGSGHRPDDLPVWPPRSQDGWPVAQLNMDDTAATPRGKRVAHAAWSKPPLPRNGDLQVPGPFG